MPSKKQLPDLILNLSGHLEADTAASEVRQLVYVQHEISGILVKVKSGVKRPSGDYKVVGFVISST